MALRWQEAAVPLGLVLLLVILKYLPGAEGLPLGRLAGIVSFGYAIFLALRLIQPEDALVVDGWSQLRASPLELFGIFGGSAFATVLMSAVAFNNALDGATSAQIAVAYGLAVVLAATSAVLAHSAFFVRVRWNQSGVERRDGRGRVIAIEWSEVTDVASRMRGVTILTADQRAIRFSPLQSGAAQLATFARRRIRQNKPAAPALWG